MPRFLLDTDHLTLVAHGHAPLQQRIDLQPAGDVVICPVTIEEVLRGRLSALTRRSSPRERIQRYALLVLSLETISDFHIVPFDAAAEAEFQRILALRLKIGMGDRKIAAVALAANLTLLTRNRRDFAQVPGLTLDDWSV